MQLSRRFCNKLSSKKKFSWANRRVSSKYVKTTLAKTKVFCNMEHLHRFVQAAILRLFVDDEVNVHICMDEVAIGRPPHMALKKCFEHYQMLMAKRQEANGGDGLSRLLQGGDISVSTVYLATSTLSSQTTK